MNINEYTIRRYCEKTRLKIYHRKPKLRLYVPFEVSTTLNKAKGETLKITINGNDITNYTYYIQNKRQTRGRYIINAYATEKYKLNTIGEYIFCIDKKIPFVPMYRYEYYFSYEKPPQDSIQNRQFNVSFYSSELLDFDEIEDRASNAIAEALGSDYLNVVVGINAEVARARYLGYEEVATTEWELTEDTKLNYPYIIIDLQKHYRPYVWCNVKRRMLEGLVSYKLSMITVDFDNIELAKVESIIGRFLYQHQNLNWRKIEIYQTTHGFHAKIMLNEIITFEELMKYRQELGDDEHRMQIDDYKWNIGDCSKATINTLFKQKWEYNKGEYIPISHETLIRVINRNTK